jgi:hypothetical protein
VLGHYPPVCYPAQGWKLRDKADADWNLGQTILQGTEYDFGRDEIDDSSRHRHRQCPPPRGQRTCRDMDGVELAAQDRRRKLLRRRQVQFAFGGESTPERRHEIVEEFVQAA